MATIEEVRKLAKPLVTLSDLMQSAHHVDIVIRFNGKDLRYEADYLRKLAAILAAWEGA